MKNLNLNSIRIIAGIGLLVFGIGGNIYLYISSEITAQDMMFMNDTGISMMLFQASPFLSIMASVSAFAGFVLLFFLPVFLRVQRGRKTVREEMNRSPYGYMNLINDKSRTARY